jgi:hypothetical protein
MIMSYSLVDPGLVEDGAGDPTIPPGAGSYAPQSAADGGDDLSQQTGAGAGDRVLLADDADMTQSA